MPRTACYSIMKKCYLGMSYSLIWLSSSEFVPGKGDDMCRKLAKEEYLTFSLDKKAKTHNLGFWLPTSSQVLCYVLFFSTGSETSVRISASSFSPSTNKYRVPGI